MMSRKNRPTELVDMGKLMSLPGVEPLLLRQTSGPGPPRKVRVMPLEEVTLGRDEDCEVVLDEGPVSRKHAKVLYQDYRPELLDLGSTNGTFLNGKRVHRAFLKQGDVIQVGANVFEIVIGQAKPGALADPASESQVRNLQSMLEKSKGNESPSPQQASAISGRITEIRLTSLLQVIESDRATGTLVITCEGREGKLHIHQGRVRHATLGRARGVKALYRMMAFEDGRFEFFIPGRNPGYETVDGDLQKHLLEGMRQKDELPLYSRRLPPPKSRLAFDSDKVIPPAKVPAMVFDVLAAVSRYHTVENIIEFCNVPDVEVCRVLLSLLKHGVLTVEAQAAATS